MTTSPDDFTGLICTFHGTAPFINIKVECLIYDFPFRESRKEFHFFTGLTGFHFVQETTHIFGRGVFQTEMP